MTESINSILEPMVKEIIYLKKNGIETIINRSSLNVPIHIYSFEFRWRTYNFEQIQHFC